MDKEIAGMDVAVGAVGSEGERRSSTLSTAPDDGAVAALVPGRRWSLSRKRDAVLRLMQGDPVEGVSRRLAVPVWKLEAWRPFRERHAAPLGVEVQGIHDRLPPFLSLRIVASKWRTAAGVSRPV